MNYDVLVVGGGPAGLYAAWRFADLGHQVVVCEEHDTVGRPVHCTGVVSADSFDEFNLPRESILNPLSTVRFVSPAGLEVRYTPPTLQAVVIDRSRFDARLAALAASAGAELRQNARVTSLEITTAGARAVAGGAAVSARLVVLACGASYKLQRGLGLGLPKGYLLTAQCELPAGRLRDVEVHFGRSVAPGGFAWAVPVVGPEGGCVRVGAMAADNAPRHYFRMLARIRERWGIEATNARPHQKVLPLGAINRTYGDRVLVIGDAAGLVKPTTGGGIHYGVLSGSIAADVGIEALAHDRLNAASLSIYEHKWRCQLADELAAQHALRDTVTKLSDDEIDGLFELARTDGIMPLVRSTARFNRHRDLIMALFRHPPARRVLFRALSA